MYTIIHRLSPAQEADPTPAENLTRLPIRESTTEASSPERKKQPSQVIGTLELKNALSVAREMSWLGFAGEDNEVAQQQHGPA
jgi:hypothetical protein